MKHILIGSAVYALAVVETTAVIPSAGVQWLQALATMLLLSLTAHQAIVWLACIGLTIDALGGGLLGVHVIAFVGVGCALRLSVSDLPARRVPVAAGAALAFIVLTTAGSLLPVAALPEDWLKVCTEAAATWVVVLASVAGLRIAAWFRMRLRRDVSSGGPMGTPVGLAVN